MLARLSLLATLLLATLLLAVVLSLGATGESRATGSAGPSEQRLSEQRVAGPREPAVRRPVDHHAAQLADDDDDVDCKPDAMPNGHHAAVAPRQLVAGAVLARSACRLSLARADAFRARQRLDDAFPTGPPSILR